MRALSIAVLVLLLAAAVTNTAPAPFFRPEGQDAEVVFEARTEERAKGAELVLRSEWLHQILMQTGEFKRLLPPLKVKDLKPEEVKALDPKLTTEHLRLLGPEFVNSLQWRRWLRTAVAIEIVGTRVRVRVRGDDALALLRVLANHLTGVPYYEEVWERKNNNVERELKHVLRNPGGGEAGRKHALAQRAEYKRRTEAIRKIIEQRDGLACGMSPSLIAWNEATMWSYEFEAEPLRVARTPRVVRPGR